MDERAQERHERRFRAGGGTARMLLWALAPPLVAFAFYWAFFALIQPYVWFLFYPAIFVSSWLGGKRAGLIATALSTALVWWFFVPPERALVKEVARLFPACVFVAMGVVFVGFHARVRETNRRLVHANRQLRLFAALVANSSDFIGIADPEGKPIYVNPAGRRMVGLGPDRDVETTQIPEYYPPEQRTFAADVILRTMIERGHWQGETYFRNWETGHAIPVSDTHFMIRDPETGEIAGMGTITRDISERRRLERAVAEASADLERAQSVAKVGSWRVDVVVGELRMSGEACRIFGLAPDARVTTEDLVERVHPDDRDHVVDSWTAALGGEALDIEHRIVVAGAIKWVREKAELERDDNGRIRGGIGIVQDLTERKQLEEELRMANARSSGILSISADAIVSIDDQQRITMFNEGAERIFGYAMIEAIGRPLDMLIPERLRAAHRAHVEKFAAGKPVARRMGERSAEIVGLRKNGDEFPADASISLLEVAGRRVLTAVVRDVTDAKRVEAEQRFLAEAGAVLSSTLAYEETLTNVAELAVRDLADYCIVDVVGDRGELRRVKVACRDPANASICDDFARIQLDPARPSLAGLALEAKEPVLVEHVTPERLGQLAQSEEHLATLQTLAARSIIAAPLVARDRVGGAIVLVASTTARAFRPQDLRLVAELARRAAISLDNAHLYAAAQQAIQSRDDIMGIVAHDLRNPLNAIQLSVGLLQDRTSGPDLHRVEAIDRAAMRMNRLIQDLLDVTRMEAGRLVLDRASVAVVPMLGEVVEAQRTIAASATLELALDVAADPGEVWADRDRLLQILENLVGNAFKFTDRGGRVTIGAAPRGGEVLFWVRDTGKGIPPEHQAHVFDRFWQSRAARRRGAGLGLPIAKGLVEAHGGRIWVESQPHAGSTFFFTIPTTRAAATHAPIEAPPSVP